YIDLQVRQRHVVCYFSMLAIINAYTIRLCLDFTLNRIMQEGKRSGIKTKSKISKAKLALPTKRPRLKRQRAGQAAAGFKLATPHISAANTADLWSNQVPVLVNVFFYAGYMLTHVPGGRLSERYGGKWILGAAILCSAVLTLLTPSIVRCGGPWALIVLRLCIGLAEGPAVPAVSVLLAQWVPEQERGLLCSSVLSGGEIGIMFVHLVSGLALRDQDWALAFYVIGTGALLWFVGFVCVCYSNPADSPFIKSEEREYIKQRVSATLVTETPNDSVPWSSMLQNAPVWAMIAASMQHDWNQLELTHELQELLQQLKSVDRTLWQDLSSSILITAPHFCSWLASLSSGVLSDYLIAEGILSRTQTRQLMSWLVFFSVSMYMVYSKEYWARSWSIMAFGAYYAGIKLLPLDMSPNYAGTLMGISNGLGAVPGLVMPLLQQLEAQYAVVGSIRAALWLLCASYISADVQAYNQ
ncbi:CG18788, partial [Drosophila busckii]